MNLQDVPQLIALLLAASTSAAVAFHTWRRRTAPAVRGFAAAMICLAVWGLANAFEMSSTSLASKVLWAKLQYVGIAFLPLAWLVFAFEYSGFRSLSRRALGVLAVVPAATLALVVSNELHGLVWRGTALDTSALLPVLRTTAGPWSRALAVYAVALLAAGSWALLSPLLGAPQPSRRYGFALMLTAVVPWMGFFLMVVGPTAPSSFGLSPIPLILTGLAVAWGLLHLHSLDLLPTARDAVIRDMHDGLIVVDLRHAIVDLNSAAEEIVGMPASEAVGENLVEVFPDAREIQELLSSTQKVHAEAILDWDGIEHRCEIRSSPLHDRRRRVRGRVLAIHDITAITRAEERYSNLFRQSKDAVFIHDSAGDIIDVNERALEQFGYRRDQILLLNIASLCPQGAEGEWRRGRERTFAEGSADFEVDFRRGDGVIFPAEVSSSLIEVGGEHIVQLILRDITERKRVQDEWKRAKDAAEASNFAKTRFLANMSHEIRTPMNAIIGMTEMVLSTQLSAEQRRFLNVVETSADSLMSLLNDILDASKIEAGKLDFEPVEFNLRDCLNDCIGVLAIRAEEKGLGLTCSLAHDVPPNVVADPGRLRQIVLNLVGNGIKFTEHGEVGVHVTTEHKGADFVSLHFEVKDTGVGISPEKLESIFDPFVQVDSSSTRGYGGTGLGLAIVSQLVELMDGRIWVESEPGKGSSFHFIAHLDLQASVPTDTVAAASDLEGMSALVVDDTGPNRILFEEMLQRFGMKSFAVSSAKEAIDELSRASREGQPYGLVLLDANMPEMNGFDLAERIRQEPDIAAATLMMLTSGGQRGDAARCRELQINAYLRKPIASTTLREAIPMSIAAAAPDGGGRLVTRHSMREARQPLRILLADDNPVNQEMAVFMLEGGGHEVEVVDTGLAAVEAVVERPGFDVVLMDAEMPGMDGLEATRVIRQKEKDTGDHVPIIAMTAHAMKGDRQRCLRAGMDGYLAKPVRRERLFEALEAVARGAPQLSKEPTAPEAPDNESTDVMDLEGALDLAKGRRALLARVATVFLDDYPKVIDSMRECMADDDSEGMRRGAHRLKGSLSTFCAGQARATAQRLEKSTREGNMPAAEELFERLEKDLVVLRSSLEELIGAGQT